MAQWIAPALPIFLFVLCGVGFAAGLLAFARLVRPHRGRRKRDEADSPIFADAKKGMVPVARMPYESGMDPIHDARRRFDVRFHLLAVAFLVFDVELLFLYPWAVGSGQSAVDSRQWAVGSGQLAAVGHEPLAVSQVVPPVSQPSTRVAHRLAFAAAMTFLTLLTLGFIYDWRKGVFRWR
jgi:NADH-quinone oxidoreductase subunit A